MCSPKLGITAISVGSHLPFHYWCYWTVVAKMDINLDSSKCQIYLFHLYCLKYWTNSANLEAFHFPSMGYCLCIPKGSDVILDDTVSERTTCLSSNRTPYDDDLL